jgi:D-serine deaminase-like pyridoxal phosphate-dependent protein
MAMSATPDRFLFIVARNNEKLANYLQQHFRGDTTVQVVIDRRYGERRQATAAAVDTERRRAERRARPHVDRELQLTSYAIVTLP